MLSGVASDEDVKTLTARFSTGELVRMMNLLQQTMAGFTRNASRRMDAELCIINLCQPELKLDEEAINARLTRLEEQVATGQFVAAEPKKQQKAVPVKHTEEDEERPPIPDDRDAPPEQPQPVFETPAGFWPDLAASVRKELKPPVSGFFAPTPNAPVQGVLRGGEVIIQCANAFTMEMVNTPEILALVSRKASARLGRQVRVKVTDMSDVGPKSKQMEQLLSFGRAHGDRVKIKMD